MNKRMKAAAAVVIAVIMLVSLFSLAVSAEEKVGTQNYLTAKWTDELFSGTITEAEEDGAMVTTYTPQWAYSWFSPSLRLYNDIKTLVGDKEGVKVVITFEVKGINSTGGAKVQAKDLIRAVNPKTNELSYDEANWDGNGNTWTTLFNDKVKGDFRFVLSGPNNMFYLVGADDYLEFSGDEWTTFTTEPLYVAKSDLDDTLYSDWMLCFDGIAFDQIGGIKIRNTAIYAVTDDEGGEGEFEFKSLAARDQVTINGTDFAGFGGNPEVTTVEKNLYEFSGQQIRFWGWYGNNKGLDKFGVRIDGGDIQYADKVISADYDGIVAHIKNTLKVPEVFAARYELLADITEGKHTAEIFAIVDGEEELIWTVKYDCLPEEAPPATEPETQPGTQPATEPNTQTGDATVAMFAVIAVLAAGAIVVFMKKKAF